MGESKANEDKKEPMLERSERYLAAFSERTHPGGL